VNALATLTLTLTIYDDAPAQLDYTVQPHDRDTLANPQRTAYVVPTLWSTLAQKLPELQEVADTEAHLQAHQDLHPEDYDPFDDDPADRLIQRKILEEEVAIAEARAYQSLEDTE
jgi:hypothetical protein